MAKINKMAGNKNVKTCWGSFTLIWNYIFASFRRNLRVPLIGITTVFLVVFFIGVLYNSLRFTSIVFWNIAESQTSQNDFTILPGIESISSYTLSDIEEELKEDKQILGISGRINFAGICTSTKDDDRNDTCMAFIQNTEKEKELGVGRSWKHRKLEKGECHATSSIVSHFGFHSGSKILFKISQPDMVMGMITPLIESYASMLPINTTSLIELVDYIVRNGSIALKLVDTITGREGKYISMGNMIMLETEYLMETLGDSAYTILKAHPNETYQSYAPTIRDFLYQRNASDIWLTIVGQFKNRLDIYTQDSDETSLDIKNRADKIYRTLGVTSPLSVAMSTYTAMQMLDLVRTFIDQMFLSTIIILVGLGAILIYTLMLSDVEEKTYEFGMIRALGVNSKQLIGLLLTQSQIYAVPGTIIGIAMSAIVVLIVVEIMSGVLDYDLPMYYESVAVILTVLLGLLMPVAANFYPIYRAVHSTLRDSLDLYHQLNSDTKVTFKNLQTLGISLPTLGIAVVIIALGFMLFMGIPTAFYSGDISSVLFLFIWVLLVMLIGFVMITVFFEPYLERLFVYIYVHFRDARFRGLVKKALSSHRSRNQKTAIMFTTSLSFVIFVGSQFALQSGQIVDMVKLAAGSDLVFTAPSVARAHNEASLMQAVDNAKDAFSEYIDDATFASYTLSAQNTIMLTTVGNLNSLDSTIVNVLAVKDNYLRGTYDGFFIPDQQQSGISFPKDPKSGHPDVFLALNQSQHLIHLPIEDDEPDAGKETILSGGSRYDAMSSQDASIAASDPFFDAPSYTTEETYIDYVDAIVSTGLLKGISVDIKTPLRLSLLVRNNFSADTTTINYLVKIHSSVQKASGLSFGKFSGSALSSSFVIPESQYMQILEHCMRTTKEKTEEQIKSMTLPIENAFVLLKKGDISTSQRSAISDAIFTGIDADSTYQDVPDLVDTVENTVMVLDIFYIIFGVIAIILCFFVLWISFTANVRENGWEFGVLRSIGLTGWQTVRVYIYEALVLVSSCIVLGSAVGIGLAFVLTVQMTMFSEMPMNYYFPVPLFVVSVSLSILTAIFGSILAANDMRHRDIASVIRSGA